MGIELPIDTPLAYAPSGGLGVLMPAADGRTDLALASDGGGFRTLLGGVTEFAWSPDGTRLATRRLGGGLWVGDRVGHAARRVDGDAEPVVGWAWLPDGRLAWQTRRGIHVIDPGGADGGDDPGAEPFARLLDGADGRDWQAVVGW